VNDGLQRLPPLLVVLGTRHLHQRRELAIGLRIQPSEADEILSAAGVDPKQRPANLTLADWREVYFAWRSQEREASSQEPEVRAGSSEPETETERVG
jgi:hypothetical protein